MQASFRGNYVTIYRYRQISRFFIENLGTCINELLGKTTEVSWFVLIFYENISVEVLVFFITTEI